MHVAGSIGMTVQAFEELANRPIVWDWVRHGLDGVEPEIASIVARQYGSAVWPCAICMLHVIKSFRISLPDIDFGATDGEAIDIFNGGQHKQRSSVNIA